MWIDPCYLQLSQRTMSNIVRNDITCLIESGSNITTIMNHIKTHHGYNVEYQTIYNIRNAAISAMIKSVSKHPGGSSVDKLINLFEVTKNVSFVYTVHRYDTGFVTFRKNRNESIQEYIHSLNDNEKSEFNNQEIKHWRDSLKLSDTNKVLVAFAWAHDEELRSAMMYPEFLAADITFGVNKQRRELFLVAGVDGRNKVFTAFRCFIPSKQEYAYTWIINQAMPHLLTSNVLKYNQCIATDQERTLNDAIHTSISSTKESFSYSKLRLDCYHFFNKVWYEKITVAVKKENQEGRNILFILKQWIMTWFQKIEFKHEFDLSMKYFKIYLEQQTCLLGCMCVDAISTLLMKITSKQSHLLHFYFKDVTTFDFVGDSIVEAANFTIKSGVMAVSNSMDIANSGYLQVKKAQYKSNKELIITAKTLNSTKTWTKSMTSQYLTDYAEGLACAMFDRRIYYTSRYIGNKSWLVISSHIFEENYTNEQVNIVHKPMSFLRCRTVNIDENNYMTCSCMYEKRWLMPCVHMCCVLEKQEYFTPDLFHLRWWKHYHYLFKNTDNNNNQQSHIKMKDTLKYVRDNHYDNMTMKYKGVPLDGTSYLESLKLMDEKALTVSSIDCKLLIMNAVITMQDKNIPLINGSNDFKKYFDINLASTLNVEVNNTHMETTEDIVDDFLCGNNDESMGIGSQMLSQLSDFREDKRHQSNKEITASIQEDVSNNSSHICSKQFSSMYERLLPTFNDIANKVKTENDFNKVLDTMNKLSFELIKDGMKNRVIANDETTFIGEQNGSRRPEKRHKTMVEKSFK